MHRLLVLALFAGIIVGLGRADDKVDRRRVALFDEVWSELSKHDAFFDPRSPKLKSLREEYRPKVAATDDPLERLRLIVRMLSRIEDGHTHLTTRFLLPDRPPPPLPLAGDQPLFRPRLEYTRFRRDYYVPAQVADASGKPQREDCRLIAIDDAKISHGVGWSLLNGPADTEVELTLQRANGDLIPYRVKRTIAVKPPEFFTTTTQAVVKDPKTGEEKTQTVEIVIEAKRLEGNLGYIRIVHLLTSQVITDFNRALDELMDTDGLVLDLRDNDGGYPWIMVPIVGRFYSTYQKVCSFEGRSPLISGPLKAIGQVGIPPVGTTYTKPLVVLINDDTASMGEGLAFSLGDTGRAALIGRPTRGLNAAIRNVTLANGLVLWHSWIRVNRADGRHYQNVGVQPHELIELPLADVQRLGFAAAADREAELQLETAITRLKARIEAKP